MTGQKTSYTVLPVEGRSEEALQFGKTILRVLMDEVAKYSSKFVWGKNPQGLAKTFECFDAKIASHTVHDMLVILQHELDDELSGKAKNKNRCADCEEFSETAFTVFHKLSGSCSSGPDIPLATDPACEHFKPRKP